MDQFVRQQRRGADLVCLLGASTTLIPPKVFEAVGRHVGVPDRVLDVLVPEVMLHLWRILAASTQLVYAKTLLKRHLESAMNSILAHCKNAVCDKSC